MNESGEEYIRDPMGTGENCQSEPNINAVSIHHLSVCDRLEASINFLIMKSVTCAMQPSVTRKTM